ncbi:MAG: hypothetical protein Q9191_005757 [Dirinaria sp. TL-2023a]
MSKHWKQDSGDSYHGGWDYEGLQVDTRAQDSTDKHLDPLKAAPKPKRQRQSNDDVYFHEKEIRVDERPHDSPTSMDSPMDSTLTSAMAGTTMVPETPGTPAKLKTMDDELPLPPEPKPQRICGMRKRIFWILFVILLVLIVAAALLGGILGGMKRSSSPSSAPEAPANPTTIPTPTPIASGPLLPQDVLVDSPLNVISYVNPGNGNPASKQTFRMYFQSAIGNISETVSDALGPWQTTHPIFTDAVNNTGLATITYLNGTQQQATIFYVDQNLNLQEKRKMFSDSNYWEQRTLKKQLQLQVRGNVPTPNNDDNDPVNNWDGYRIAAVHSTAFHAGPQARVFYRSQNMDSTGNSVIQELIWNQNNDTWSKGTNFSTAWPTSQMTATIDESTNILRLFFSTGKRTLQEYWTDITAPEIKYTEGLSLPTFLTHNNAQISALSHNGTTYIYRVLPGTNNTIHETQITGVPGSINDQETYNVTSPLVVKPASVSTQGNAVYQPFAAAKTNVTGLPTSFFTFWADDPVGWNETAKLEGGYGHVGSIQRALTDANWPAKEGGAVDQVPLGPSS